MRWQKLVNNWLQIVFQSKVFLNHFSHFKSTVCSSVHWLFIIRDKFLSTVWFYSFCFPFHFSPYYDTFYDRLLHLTHSPNFLHPQIPWINIQPSITTKHHLADIFWEYKDHIVIAVTVTISVLVWFFALLYWHQSSFIMSDRYVFIVDVVIIRFLRLITTIGSILSIYGWSYVVSCCYINYW